MRDDSPERTATTIQVAGPITLGEVARWRDEFGDRLARAGSLRLDLGASGPWDLAGAQLLLAASLSCERTGRSFRLVHVPSVFLTIAERSGLLERFSAMIDDRIG